MPLDRPTMSPSAPAPTPVPDTNPHIIEELWIHVASAAVASMSSRGNVAKRVRPGRGAGAGAASRAGSDGGEKTTSASAPQSLLDPSESLTTPGSTSAHTARVISPRSPRFAKVVLHPCGIFVNDENSIVPSAFSHFGTQQPTTGGYRELEGLGGANVWVEMDESAIKETAAEYKEMRGLGLCEEEFASLAKEIFFRRERRSAEVSEDRQWRAERMLQLVCPPNNTAHWRAPPRTDDLAAGDDSWSWDLRPDCAYWLSLRGFNPRYRFQIQNCAFVLRDWITCPYFTIEFKRDGVSKDAAEAQVAAAGSLALYNRYRLHAKAHEAGRKPDDVSTLRHYALTFVGSKFVFWVLQPDPDPEDGCSWGGCTMKRLCGADCANKYGVQGLVDWINEIDRWGLSVHAPSCEKDIKTVLRAGGVRTSDIHD